MGEVINVKVNFDRHTKGINVGVSVEASDSETAVQVAKDTYETAQAIASKLEAESGA